jgi:hypothetical protein
MAIRIIAFQIVDVVKELSHGELTIDKVVSVMYGLGLDGVVYVYDDKQHHWNPYTTNRVNPSHRQPKRLQKQVEDILGGGEEKGANI